MLRPFLQITFGLMANFRGSRSLFRWRKFYAGAPRLGKSNGNRLFHISRAVYAVTNVFDFFADKFSGLR